MIDNVRKHTYSRLLRWRLLAMLGAAVALAPGIQERMYPKQEPAPDGVPLQAGLVVHPPARLVHLSPGVRLEGDRSPAGWSNVVIKSLPRLATGDLDTVSAQAYETAQRVRLTIVADVRKSTSGPPSFFLDRVGVGLCSPAQDGHGEVVVSPTSVEGSGPWTTKQRLVLAATSLDLARITLGASTSTFALIRTPVTFLVSGTHRKVSVCYAVAADPGTGSVRTFVWMDDPEAPARSSPPAGLRLLAGPAFDCPIDIQARRLLGSIPVTWSFAVRDLPPGVAVEAPPNLASLLATASASESADLETSRRIEAYLVSLLRGQL